MESSTSPAKSTATPTTVPLASQSSEAEAISNSNVPSEKLAESEEPMGSPLLSPSGAKRKRSTTENLIEYGMVPLQTPAQVKKNHSNRAKSQNKTKQNIFL